MDLESRENTLTVPNFLGCGAMGGSLWPSNEPIQQALNQAWDDGLSRCWHADAVDAIDILGAPSLRLEVSSDQPVATLCARLVDVFPDGKATLISYGTVLFKPSVFSIMLNVSNTMH